MGAASAAGSAASGQRGRARSPFSVRRRSTGSEKGLGGGAGQVLAVQPLQLLEVEDGALLQHPLQGKGLHQLVPAEHLPVVARGPTQKRQEVDHGLGKDPLLLVVPHRRGAVALGEALSVGAQDEGHVGECRDRIAQSLMQEDLLRGVGEVVVTP